MKLTFALLFVVSMGVFATGNAQTMRVNISADNVSTGKILSEIERQTDYLFVYDKNEVDLKRKTSVNAVNKTTAEVLSAIFDGTDIVYAIEGENIMLMRREKELAATPAAAQQDHKITGTVLDPAGVPVIGANIVIKGTTTGTITDMDGKFALEVPSGATLVVTYVGYATQEIPVGNQKTLSITLKEDTEALDEVVVVGYGTQKKVNVTGAVSTVNYAKEAESRPVTSVAQLMQGMSAGTAISQQTSMPGTETLSMRIRGIGTLNNADPLVIIDGFACGINNVNPDDIESISILKDAASCAIYGNQGANGVILITTKTGGAVKTISYSGMMAFQQPSHRIGVVSNYADYMEFMNESAENVDATLPFSQGMIDLWREKEKDPYGIAESGYPNYVAYPNTDWMDALYENNIYHKHNVTASGSSSSGDTKYLISFTFMDNPGIMPKMGYKQYQLRANVSSQVTPWLEIGAKLSGEETSRELTDIDTNWTLMSHCLPCVYPYYDGKYGGPENREQNTHERNYLFWIYGRDGEAKSHRIDAILFANVNLPFHIKYHASYKYARLISNTRSHNQTGKQFSFQRNQYEYTYDDLSILSMTRANNDVNSWYFSNNLSWDYTFGGKHDVTALVGFEAVHSLSESLSAQKDNFAQNELFEMDLATNMKSITGTRSDYASASFFGRLTYAYDNRYLFETNLRYDGSSRFASGSRWGLFPSVSAGWRISQEAFMQDSGIDELKLRASWGKLGNNSIGNYDYMATYATGYLYSFGGNEHTGLVRTYANEKLKWETTTNTDVGLELGVFRNRLSFEGDWYNRVTDGILARGTIAGSVGNKAAPLENLAEVTNKGFELTLGWRDRVKDFSYGISANFSRNWNEVTKYKGPLNAGWVTNEDGSRVYQTNLGDVSTGDNRRVMEGKMINEYYLLETYKGDGSHFFSDGSVNPQGGPRDGMIRTEEDMEWLKAMVAAGNHFLPNETIDKAHIWYGDLIYADVNGDGIYGNEYDKVFQNKSRTPKFYYGFQIDLGWKGIDLSMNWNGAGGSVLYWYWQGINIYSTRLDMGISKEIAYDHYFYNPENPSDPRTNLTSEHGRLTMNYGANQSRSTSTHWLYNTDYLRLKNLTVGYTLPKKWLQKIHLQNVRVYFSGENLWTITSYPGYDPEYIDSSTNYYPALRQYSIGLNVKF